MEHHVEKSKEDPIPTRKLMMIVNDYVVNSTRFVNRFHAVCEEKLQTVSKRITQTVQPARHVFATDSPTPDSQEIMLSILEGKINSVDYVSNMATTAGTAAAAADVLPDVAADAPAAAPAATDASAQPQAGGAEPAAAAGEPEPPPAPAAPAGPSECPP